jgi:Family of unknown function (DUF6267)/Cytidylyltransferase-like
MLLTEGGNIFKSKDGQPLTQRINQADVIPTLKWLESILDIDLVNNTIGTTGKNPTSGDLDISVDETEVPKDQVYNELLIWVSKNIPDANPREYVAKTGIEVHFRTPIKGDPSNGYVQTDLMFGDPQFMKWAAAGEPPGEFKGQHRQILIASIAKFRGYRWSGFLGLTPRSGGDRITNPQQITDILLGKGHKPEDLTSIHKILSIIKDDPDYEALVADAVATFPKYGSKFPDIKSQSPLMEANVSEGPRIQHAEDLIFWEGSDGAIRALDALASLATEQGQKSTSLKWDGSPAVIFGRDENGDFVFTDKSGFTAKGYDGKAKSPEELENIFVNVRKVSKGKEVTPDYMNFINNLKNAFTIFEKATPLQQRGYFFGDLLYVQTPQVIDGNYNFKPNIVNYRIDAKSDIGKRIGKSKVGVVVHGQIDFEGNKSGVKDYSIFQGNDLLVVPPVLPKQPVKIDTKQINTVKNKIASNASKIDDLLNKETLRSLKISNLADLFYTYTNSKVDTGLQGLGSDFESWLTTSKVSDNAKQNVLNYIKQNKDGFNALWDAVVNIMSVKNNIIRQLDSQDAPVKSSIGSMEGGEGYVIADPAGYIKLVDREGFTKANRSVQRESLIKEQLGHAGKRVIAIYPGRFHPFHKGHKSAYQSLVTKFGEDNVFIFTTGKQEQPKSPFSFEEKKKMMMLTGVKEDKIVRVASPYNAREVVNVLGATPEDSILVYGISGKDMLEDPRFSFRPKINGDPSYLQPFAENNIQTMDKHGYIVTVPTIEFYVLGKPASSASQLRKQFASLNMEEQKLFIVELFGSYDPEVHQIMINRLINMNEDIFIDEITNLLLEMSAMGGGNVEGTMLSNKTQKKQVTPTVTYSDKDIISIVNKRLKELENE